MKRGPFLLLQIAILSAGIGFGILQDRALRAARASVPPTAMPGEHQGGDPSEQHGLPPIRGPHHPSLDLLKLRSEVTQLRAELDLDPARAKAEADGATEWAQVFDAVRPSRMPDFVSFIDLAPRGNADPISAFATFQYRMRHQADEPMTPSRMKEIWDVPDDFDDPQARYSIDLGRGMGREIGYRVVEQQFLETGEVRLVLDLETADGDSFRADQVLVQRNGQWRVKPQWVKRMADPDSETPSP